MSEQEFIFAPPTVRVRFDIHPVDIHLNSLMIINQEDVEDGVGAWVNQTRRAFRPDQAEAHKLVFGPLMKGIDYEQRPPSFPAYMDWVESMDTKDLRNRILEDLICLYDEMVDKSQHGETSIEKMVTNKSEYLRVLDLSLGVKYADKGMTWDSSLHEKAFALLTEPIGLKAYILNHLRFMWDKFLRADWEKSLPMLEESVEAFRQMDYNGLSALEVARAVTGRDLSSVWPQLESATDVLFMPSPHIGPYVSYYAMDGTSYIIYGARVPEGMRAKSSALSRSELLTRLSALADDTRLAILELLTQHDELFAQDIMTRLDLSQSSASRHLRQLSATGFLIEKRRDVAKYYMLNRDRLEDTLDAIRHFLRF